MCFICVGFVDHSSLILLPIVNLPFGTLAGLSKFLLVVEHMQQVNVDILPPCKEHNLLCSMVSPEKKEPGKTINIQ